MLECYWEMTKRCNLSCLHCILGDPNNLAELNTQKSIQAIEKMAALGCRSLRISGGEPLMRKDLSEIFDVASNMGMDIEIITNGTLLDDALLANIGKNIQHVAFSVDGLPKIHDKIRGKGSYSLTATSIKHTLELKIPVSVSITINALNLPYLSTILTELIELGVEHFHINDLNLQGRAVKYRDILGIVNTNPSELEEYILKELDRIIVWDKKDLAKDEQCTIKPDTIYMDCVGNVYPCVEIATLSPDNTFGNILDDDIVAKIESFFRSQETFPVCCYKVITIPGITICLNNNHTCPLVGR